MKEEFILGGGLIILLVLLVVILKLCSKFRNKVYQLFIKAEKEARKETEAAHTALETTTQKLVSLQSTSKLLLSGLIVSILALIGSVTAWIVKYHKK